MRCVFLGIALAFILAHDAARGEDLWADMPDPMLDGKPLSDWLKGLGGKDWKEHKRPAEVLEKLGPKNKDCIKRLIHYLWTCDCSPGYDQPLYEAYWTLSRIGPGIEAIPLLFDAQAKIPNDVRRGPQDPYEYKRLLSAMGPKAIPHLLPYFESDNWRLRQMAVMACGGFDVEAKAALPGLLKLLGDSHYAVRHEAARAILFIDPEQTARALPMLSADFDSEDPKVSYGAKGVLGNYGARALPLIDKLINDALSKRGGVHTYKRVLMRCYTQAVPMVAKHLQDDMPARRANALSLLAAVGSPSRAAEDAIIGLLADKDRSVRARAVYALERIEPTPAKAVPALIPMLQTDLTWSAANALGEMEVAAVDAVPALLEAMKGPSSAACARALARIAPDTPGLAKPLLDAQRAADRMMSREANLSLLGVRAADVLPDLLADLDAHPGSTAERLKILQWRGRGAIPALLKLIEKDQLKSAFGDPEEKSPDYDDSSTNPDKREVFAALGAMGKAGTAAVPLVLQQARANRSCSRHYALALLAALGKDAYSKETLSYLIEELQRPERQDAYHVYTALSKFGAEAARALPALVDLLRKDDRAAKRTSKWAWCYFGEMSEKGLISQTIEDILKETAGSPEAASARNAAIAYYEKQAASDVKSARMFGLAKLARVDKGRWLQPYIAELQSNLHDETGAERNEALERIGELGPDAAPLVPKLIDLLGVPVDYLRMNVLHALAKIGPPAKAAVPRLLSMLDWNEKGDPARAAEGRNAHKTHSGWIGTDLMGIAPGTQLANVVAAATLLDIEPAAAKEAVPFLKAALSRVEYRSHGYTIGGACFENLHDSKTNALTAAECLLRIDPSDADALRTVVELTRNTGRYVRHHAASVLARRAPSSAGAAVPVLIEALYNEWGVIDTMKLLEQIPAAAKPALPLLREMAEHAPYETRVEAARCIETINRH